MLLPITKYCFSLAKNCSILGLKRNAKFDQVKRKYYQLAKIYHPDVNKQESSHMKFAQITKAYKYIVQNIDKEEQDHEQTTTNRKQDPPRPKYTNKNEKRHKATWQQEQFQPFNEYDQYYKHAKKFRKPKIGQNLYINIKISLEESINGIEKQINYTKYQPCSHCATKNFTACIMCGGKGEVYNRANRQKVACQSCSRRGFVNQCIQCLGASYVLKEVKDIIYIEKGIQDKTILKLLKKGHSGYKAHNGDLYITVFVQQSQKFKIEGNNIHSELQLDFITATCGGLIQAQTVYGKKQVKIESGTQSGAIIRIFNAGLKSPYSRRMGDQIIKVKIKIPINLTTRQRQLIKKLHQVQN